MNGAVPDGRLRAYVIGYRVMAYVTGVLIIVILVMVLAAGAASFLRGVSMFQTQALVEETLSGAPARTRVADFEPWTDERVAAAAHTQAAYVCPMHPSVGAGAPGKAARRRHPHRA